MSCLSSKQLRDRLYHPDASERLVITPVLDIEGQVAKAAADVRLGSEFITLRRTRVAGLMVDGIARAQAAREVASDVEKSHRADLCPD